MNGNHKYSYDFGAIKSEYKDTITAKYDIMISTESHV